MFRKSISRHTLLSTTQGKSLAVDQPSYGGRGNIGRGVCAAVEIGSG